MLGRDSTLYGSDLSVGGAVARVRRRRGREVGERRPRGRAAHL